MCHKCNKKLHLYNHYIPEIGDKIVITNDTVSHGIPVGTVMDVKHLYNGVGNTCVLDYEVSFKNEIVPGLGIVIPDCDYAVTNIHEYEAKEYEKKVAERQELTDKSIVDYVFNLARWKGSRNYG